MREGASAGRPRHFPDSHAALEEDLLSIVGHGHSRSMIRVAAGASGFFTLTQSGDRPDR
jgi:hypothetical protein